MDEIHIDLNALLNAMELDIMQHLIQKTPEADEATKKQLYRILEAFSRHGVKASTALEILLDIGGVLNDER